MSAFRLVLLPGLDGTGVLFRPLLEFLPAAVHPLVQRYPGDRPEGYEELLVRVQAALPPSGPYLLLGESFSGPLALMAAASHPAGLRGVVLVASFAASPAGMMSPWLRHFVHPVLFRLDPRLWVARLLAGRHGASGLAALFAEARAEVRPEVLAHRLRAVLRVNAWRELNACKVPVLYLRGTRDWVVPGRCARAIERARPSVEVVDFAAPHMVLQTYPREAAEAILRFAKAECGLR